MPPTSRLLLLPVLAGLLGLGGCDSATFSRDEVAGVYVLARVNGEPLPAVVEDDPFFRVTLLSGVLELRGDGTGEETTLTRSLNRTSGGPEEELRVESTLGYDLEGDRIEISYGCPPNALCVPGPHLRGRVAEDELVLELLGRQTRVYRRAGP